LWCRISTIHTGIVTFSAIHWFQLELVKTCTSCIRWALLRAVNCDEHILIFVFGEWLHVELSPAVFHSVAPNFHVGTRILLHYVNLLNKLLFSHVTTRIFINMNSWQNVKINKFQQFTTFQSNFHSSPKNNYETPHYRFWRKWPKMVKKKIALC